MVAHVRPAPGHRRSPRSLRPSCSPTSSSGFELLATTGVDYTLVIHFDEARAGESAEEFVREVLVGCLGPRRWSWATTSTSATGGGKCGASSGAGRELGFGVLGLRLIEMAPTLRTRRRDSPVPRRGRRSPRPPRCSVATTRSVGSSPGRRAGWPRAPDIPPPTSRCRDPAAGRRHLRGLVRAAVRSGPRDRHLARTPAHVLRDAADASLLEAYLLDFDGDLYGELAKVRFVTRLRDELKFDSVDALIAQMGKDVEAARRSLSIGSIGGRRHNGMTSPGASPALPAPPRCRSVTTDGQVRSCVPIDPVSGASFSNLGPSAWYSARPVVGLGVVPMDVADGVRV